MSASGNLNQITQQLQQDLQNELSTANQLLRLISVELQQIKYLTNHGGELEANIIQNTSLIKTLANIQQADIDNLPPFARKQIDIHVRSHNVSDEEHNTSINHSEMEESQ